MRVGVLGGTFNPIHRAHVEIADFAREAGSLDLVLFVPTAIPPHKDATHLAPAWRRYVMAELALLDLDWATVSSRELRQDRASYTIDTMEGLRDQHPDTDWVLLIGGDSLAQLTTWRRWQDLLAFEILVFSRPCGDCPEFGEVPSEVAREGAQRISWIENKPVNVSSTEIRAQLGAGSEPTDLHPRVLEYARKYSLYI